MATLSKAENPNGMLVFGVQGIGEKAAKIQFEELMMFIKKMSVMFHLRVGVMMQMNAMCYLQALKISYTL